MSTRSKITSKSQVTVPRGVRRSLNVGPGDQIEWVDQGDEVVVRKVPADRLAAIDKWAGSAKTLEGVDVIKLIDEMRGR